MKNKINNLETLHELVDYLEEQLDLARAENEKLTEQLQESIKDCDTLKITLAELFAEEIIHNHKLN